MMERTQSQEGTEMKIAFSRCLAVLALVSFLEAARADPSPPPQIVGSATSLGDGLYKYQYTVTNIGGGTYLETLAIKAPMFISSAQYSDYIAKYSNSPTAPFLYVTASQEFGLVNWSAPDGSGLTWGQSATISFVAPFQPGMVPYTVVYYTPERGGGYGILDYGSVVGPVDNAPEPATGVLAGLGALSLAIARGCRRAARRRGLRAIFNPIEG